MADGIDAAVDRMQPAVSDPSVDRTRADPQRPKLPPRHHPVLTLSQLPDDPVDTTRA